MKVPLFTKPTTTGQQLVVGLWYLNLFLVLVLWSSTSWPLLTSGNVGNAFVAIGRLFGLLAVVFALTQFMLMGRVLWIERRFGLDHLAAYHRLNGYYAITAILIHPMLIVTGYSLQTHTGFVSQYFNVVEHYSYVWLALIAEFLFIFVVASSIYIVRKHLKFENWYLVHLSVYLAITIVFFHQLAVGGSFLGHPLARAYWYGLYAFVAVNVLFYRFSLPSLNSLRFGFKVSRVVAETPTTTSVYIKGHGLHKWRHRPGQFVLVRFLDWQHIGQEHPFSMSQVPKNDEFRLTIRHSGDFTNAIGVLKVGTPVLVAGPYGRFTNEIATTDKRLFIAGGVGITPLRTLSEQAIDRGLDSIMIYGNRNPDDVVFEQELGALKNLKIAKVFSDAPPNYKGLKGYVSASLIAKLVPDYKDRDIFLCGPLVMMNGIIDELGKLGVDPERLHFERFELHV